MGTREFSKETVEKVMSLRPIDDAFFQQLAADKEVCEEMLQTFLEDKKLKVLKVISQYKVVSLHRAICMDALCELSDGKICNVEVQKGDANDDLRRVRFHTSALTANKTPKGSKFSEIPDVTVIYITEYDSLGNGQMITKERHCVEEQGVWYPVSDGEEVYFLNAIVKEDNDISELLQLFLKRDIFKSEKFPSLADKVSYYKSNEEGVRYMCKVIEEYVEETVISIAKNMLRKNHGIKMTAECTMLNLEEVQAIHDELVRNGEIKN